MSKEIIKVFQNYRKSFTVANTSPGRGRYGCGVIVVSGYA